MHRTAARSTLESGIVGVDLRNGDSLLVLPTCEAGSVACCVTSPPYFGVRDYGVVPTGWPEVTFLPMAALAPITIPAMSSCLGREGDPLAYVAHLVALFRQVRRVLSDDGSLWLNIGDTRAANRTYQVPSTKGGPRHAAAQGFEGSAMTVPEGLKAKDMLGVPWRVALALQAEGWYLRSDVIWHKGNAMPSSANDRPTDAHEHVFLFSKRGHYYYDAVATREPCRGATVGYRNRRSVWEIDTEGSEGGHAATMPSALVRTCILASTVPGDVVLDPFAGSGTVPAEAIALDRKALAIELNPLFIPLIDHRVGKSGRQPGLFGG